MLSGFFNYALRNKFLAESPIHNVTNPRVEDLTPTVLSIPQVTAVLLTALLRTDLDLLPYVTLGVFCGIRSGELTKLDWSAIDLEAGQITISHKIAKKRRIRIISIPNCCRAWLLAGGVKKSGLVRPTGFQHRWVRFVVAADRFPAEWETPHPPTPSFSDMPTNFAIAIGPGSPFRKSISILARWTPTPTPAPVSTPKSWSWTAPSFS